MCKIPKSVKFRNQFLAFIEEALFLRNFILEKTNTVRLNNILSIILIAMVLWEFFDPGKAENYRTKKCYAKMY